MVHSNINDGSVTRTQDDLRLRREAKAHVHLYLSESEEKLIRAIRIGNFKEARWTAEMLINQRMAEDSAIAQLNAGERQE
jgi:hypothetical protein